MFQEQSIAFFYYYLFVSLFISFVISSVKNDASSSNTYCTTSTCNGVDISYPFWRVDNYNSSVPRYCGYPGFGINCPTDQPHPVIHLPGDTFYVTEIDYRNYSLTLVGTDVLNNVQCPRARHNLTIEKLPLEVSDSDSKLTFYFNCTKRLTGALPAECLTSNGKMTYFYVGESHPNDLNWFGICDEKVVATVMERRSFQNNDWIDKFGAAMGEGFQLDWRHAAECRQCEGSDGKCGYNNSTQIFLCYCKDGTVQFKTCKGAKTTRSKLGLTLGAGISLFIVGLLALLFCFRKKISWYNYIRFWESDVLHEDHLNIEEFLKNSGSYAPKRYNYTDIKRITSNFKNKLGQGGFGNVYRGSLHNGSQVAVKVLNELKGNGEDFINEVASISRTSHVNIVSLVGFCFEGRKRALVYEFMPNGSLEKFIYEERSDGVRQLGWPMLYKIALGIARGLEYLHRGCNTRILHFDIKPHNILLDEDFYPKISDFGLAKMCMKKESIVSMLGPRGTIGYIAPEIVCRNLGGVSHKSDVYSYGMMVLEMVGGRKNVDVGVDRTSEIYFPHWLYRRIELDEELQLIGIMNEEENECARKMVMVSLWCIQTDPSNRPSMSKVVEMLEGKVESLQMPPKPYLYSPSRSEVDSSAIELI